MRARAAAGARDVVLGSVVMARVSTGGLRWSGFGRAPRSGAGDPGKHQETERAAATIRHASHEAHMVGDAARPRHLDPQDAMATPPGPSNCYGVAPTRWYSRRSRSLPPRV